MPLTKLIKLLSPRTVRRGKRIATLRRNHGWAELRANHPQVTKQRSSPNLGKELSSSQQVILEAFNRHIPLLEKSGVLDLGSPQASVALHVLKREAGNAITYVARAWDRVEDAIIAASEAIARRPSQRAHVTYQIGGLNRLDVHAVARHGLITCVLGEPGLNGLSDQPRPGSNGYSTIEELLDWYAGLVQQVPVGTALPGLLIAVPEPWLFITAALTEENHLHLESKFDEPLAQLVVLHLRHTQRDLPHTVSLPDEQVLI